MIEAQDKRSAAATARQRRASESDSMFDRAEPGGTTVGDTATGGGGKRNVDIMQMLSKAQDEYDKVTVVTFDLT